MSFIERIFGKPAPAPAPAQAAPAASNDPTTNPPPAGTAQSQQTAPNGIVPADASGQSPLEKFGDLWKPVETDPNSPKPPTPVTVEQIMEAAGKVDFAKVLSQEEWAKVAAGGNDAIAALSSVLNKSMQVAYGHSAFAATKLVEQAVSQAEDRFASKLPTLINQQSSKNALLENNPAFSNPAVAPIVDMIHQQLTNKFPAATPKEIADMAKEMMSGAAQVFNPSQKSGEEANKAKAAGEDWSLYAN